MSDRRPKRRCVAAKAQVMPSAIHYVGYVEDDETPEMIMKKFEELERIQKAAEARRQQQQQHEQQAPATRPPTGTYAGTSHPDTSHLGAAAGNTVNLAPGSSAAPLPSCEPGGPPGFVVQQGGPGQAADPSAPPQPQLGQTGGYTEEGPAAAVSGGGGGSGVDAEQPLLDEEVLLEVFKHTSIYNVRRAALYDGTEGLLGGAASRYDVAYGMEDLLFVGGGGEAGPGASDLDEEELQQMKGFWSDEDYELGGGSRGRDGRRRKAGAGSGAGGRSGGGPRSGGGHLDGDCASRDGKQTRGSAPSLGQSRHVMNQMVMQYNRDTNALIRRRVASGGSGGGTGGGSAGGLVQLRVPPPPLPLSWGRTVLPYQPPEPYPSPTEVAKAPHLAGAAEAYAAETTAANTDAAGASPSAAAAAAASSRGFEADDLATFPYESALGGKQYIAVMINAGWQSRDAADHFERGGEAAVMRSFRRLPLPRLCPRGFVLVWAHKGLLQAVCRALAVWGYVYVENLTWVHLTPGNAISTQRGRHFRRSHSTLLIFRKEGEGRDIELRHQRNPDVVFDCVRTLPDGGGWDVPSEVLSIIETMLPGGRGAFLELWAPRGHRRPGWDHVCEVSAAEMG